MLDVFVLYSHSRKLMGTRSGLPLLFLLASQVLRKVLLPLKMPTCQLGLLCDLESSPCPRWPQPLPGGEAVGWVSASVTPHGACRCICPALEPWTPSRSCLSSCECTSLPQPSFWVADSLIFMFYIFMFLTTPSRCWIGVWKRKACRQAVFWQ